MVKLCNSFMKERNMNKKLFLKLLSIIILMMTNSFSTDYYHKGNLDKLKQECKSAKISSNNQLTINKWFYSYMSGYSIDNNVIKTFINDCGADINFVPKDSNAAMPPLLIAIDNGDIHLVRLLVNSGANINIDTPWRSPLRFSLLKNKKDSLKIFSYLLENGANPNYKDTSEVSIITTIARASQKYLSNKNGILCAKELLKYNATVTHKDIQWAKKNDKIKLYKLLKK